MPFACACRRRGNDESQNKTIAQVGRFGIKGARGSGDNSAKLKNTPEQKLVVGPLVAQLVALGWALDQIVFGKQEWRVPSSPSEAT